MNWNFLLGNLFDWVLLGSLFLFALYTLYVIKNEKNTFLKNAVSYQIDKCKFLIPNWWTPVQLANDPCYPKIYSLYPNSTFQFHAFYRQDTRYDWRGKFLLSNQADVILKNYPGNAEVTTLENFFIAYCQFEHIEFDSDVAIMQNTKNPHFKLYALATSSPQSDFQLFRLEGTATVDKENRCYIDLFMAYSASSQALMIFESRSSILNGLIEGPYFEDVIKTITYS